MIKPKKAKKRTKSKLQTKKKEAQRLFRKLRRLETSIETTGGITACYCCTCGKLVETGSQLHGGHYIHNRLGSYFLPENCHGQCIRCNYFGSGEESKYKEFLIDKYGEYVIEYLEEKSKEQVKLKAHDYEDMIAVYKDKIVRIEKEYLYE